MAPLPSVPPHMLPGRESTIHALLHFPLPIQSYGRPPPIRADALTAAFVTTEPSCTDLQHITTIEVPVAKLLDRMIKTAEKAVVNGAKAMKILHATTDETVPLWILPYWQGVGAAREKKDLWLGVERFLLREHNPWTRERPARAPVAAVMRAALELLYPRREDEMLQGFPDPQPIGRLSTFASEDWLSTWHMDLQLALLREELARSGNHEVHVASAYMYKCIIAAFKDKERYDEAHHQAVFRLGTRLVLQSLDLASAANVDDNHWIVFAIMRGEKTVYYGDATAAAFHPQFVLVMNWWIDFHLAREFVWSRMMVTKQVDGFSCGILGGNALRHFYAGQAYPLAIGGARGADAERADVLLRVLLHDRVRRFLDSC